MSYKLPECIFFVFGVEYTKHIRCHVVIFIGLDLVRIKT
jgi:hypothetical protein